MRICTKCGGNIFTDFDGDYCLQCGFRPRMNLDTAALILERNKTLTSYKVKQNGELRLDCFPKLPVIGRDADGL